MEIKTKQFLGIWYSKVKSLVSSVEQSNMARIFIQQIEEAMDLNAWDRKLNIIALDRTKL